MKKNTKTLATHISEITGIIFFTYLVCELPYLVDKSIAKLVFIGQEIMELHICKIVYLASGRNTVQSKIIAITYLY